ncbi:glycosyl hydrolase family 28-related protein [Ectobacillus panaciterrae]|uniref:glycosyl hydrolase family 28-related protein n=1 Tax=Ectobacillus panaciterrae TaxID=363872 RepID=UPI000556EB90|nr:glycosyl hydrolase family 28-related protein [Ectobacillus panaciterrae]
MLYLDKKHDPRKNAKLLSQITESKQDIKKAIKETERLFHQHSMNGHILEQNYAQSFSVLAFLKKFVTSLTHLTFTSLGNDNIVASDTFVDEKGNVYPRWKERLDTEYAKLMNEIHLEVNVADYGAVGDGITDNTKAFKKAIGNGRVKVHVPEGVFLTKGIRLPSWTCLIGKGKGVTTIKLHNDTPKGTRLVTNANHLRGNRNILVQGMSLDWNVGRLASTDKTSTGGNHSSCLTFANVSLGWVKDVEGIDAGLHCFDVSSTFYNYSGDGTRARGGSKYVWLDNLNGYGFGDDGITTHHSDYILISNSHMCDPSGRAHDNGASNSNGIEIDDGSRNVWLVNNSTSRCFGGVEIKAHHNSSAASNVQIIGHISVNDNRSYNFRHIGHHKSTDPESKTAYNIKATNIAAIAPIYTELYTDSTPRGMVVSAYRNVVINNFTLIGDPDYNYKGNSVIAIQYRARNVVLNNVAIRNFKSAGVDIKVFGGEHRADHIHICNVMIRNSAPQAIDIGSGVQSVRIHKVIALSQNGRYGFKAANFPTSISEFYARGYKTPFSIAGNDYETI